MTRLIRTRWIATVMCLVSLGTMAGVAACGGGDEGNADVTGDPSRPVVPSPIPTARLTPNPPSPAIPEGVMPIEEVAARPAEDPDVR